MPKPATVKVTQNVRRFALQSKDGKNFPVFEGTLDENKKALIFFKMMKRTFKR